MGALQSTVTYPHGAEVHYVMSPAQDCQCEFTMPPHASPTLASSISHEEAAEFHDAVNKVLSQYSRPSKIIRFLILFPVLIVLQRVLGVSAFGQMAFVGLWWLGIITILGGLAWVNQMNERIDERVSALCREFTAKWRGLATAMYLTEHTGLCKPRSARATRALIFHSGPPVPVEDRVNLVDMNLIPTLLSPGPGALLRSSVVRVVVAHDYDSSRYGVQEGLPVELDADGEPILGPPVFGHVLGQPTVGVPVDQAATPVEFQVMQEGVSAVATNAPEDQVMEDGVSTAVTTAPSDVRIDVVDAPVVQQVTGVAPPLMHVEVASDAAHVWQAGEEQV